MNMPLPVDSFEDASKCRINAVIGLFEFPKSLPKIWIATERIDRPPTMTILVVFEQ